ncbi:LAQU0S03e01046g1_1 [Lachancea quebecensis]|uniref:LAQU0S03e01046g1_1 n=1 Tax=Lachancea quebecensis TaxID=1654605 RepID=A0A0P1KPD7_9SACH|nr:LAQU0S03e01046g1_1 [Lachancea quebecensis]
MAKRLLPNDVEIGSDELKRQRAEAAEQSNIDAELLKEKQDPASGDEDVHRDDDDDDQDHESTAAAAAVAAAAYGGFMGGQDDPNHELHHAHHAHHHHDAHEAKVEDDDDDDDASSLKDEDGKRSGRRGRKPAPVTGSAEWRQQRKDSHKEVERRRRENINTAINKLSELLPVKESSKASILLRAAEYILKLKDTENANIEKWTLQKLLGEQQVSTLTKANESLQLELGNAFKQVDILKRQLRNAGISVDPEIAKLEAEATRNE